MVEPVEPLDPIEPVDPMDPIAVSALRQYFDELDRRFPGGFDPGDAITADAAAYDAPTGVFLLARSGESAIACGAVAQIDEVTAEIKRMWVHEQWRGRGLGSRMLGSLEQHALRLGHGRVILDTNSTLVEAIAMYRRAGYRDIERYNDNPYALCWFEKLLD